MFGALPASFMLDIARSEGVMYQLELELEPPYVFVNPEYLVEVPTGHSVYRLGNRAIANSQYSVLGTEDHPFFRDTRKWLSNNGYIKMQEAWSNGDTVLKPFYFNNVLKEEGESFLCASAMKHSHTESYNDGIPAVKLPA